jgi:hypothetical protein
MERGNYKKLLIIQVFSFIIMYSVMFSNVDKTDNILLNLNRFYMTILMVAPMAVLMLIMMSSMFKDKKLNTIIYLISSVSIIITFILLRTQTLIGDKEFMHSMIPHHSSAILVSEEANIRDPELKELAKEIIKSQKEEIAQMKSILKRMESAD